MVDSILSQRIVPGAPPPAPLSKSQKKKKKTNKSKVEETSPTVEIPDSTAAALTEKAPTQADIQKEAVASELVAPLETINDNTSEKPKRISPVVELVAKRIKLQTKKASRIASYASKAHSELNEDQKKSIASLPFIQGGIKELEETKKAIELTEAEEFKELEKQRAEDERTTQERISQSVSNAKELYLQRASIVLSLIHLSASLNSSDPSTLHLNLSDGERHGIQTIVEALIGLTGPKKNELLSRLLDGEGDLEGLSYDRILFILESYRNPPIEEDITFADGPEPPVEEEPVEAEPEAEPEAVQTEQVIEPAVGATGSFHFMQESELEDTTFENGAEWVEKPEEHEEHEDIVANGVESDVTEAPAPVVPNGTHAEQLPVYGSKLDWAADDNEDMVEAEIDTNERVIEGDIPSSVNGIVEVDEDGFVKTKNGRGRQPDHRPDYRGRGRGFRGDRGGEHRGGFRGRGDGEFRGRGGFRGDRGRGEFRGRSRGGDFRGRGRNGERGGFKGGRGGHNENRSEVQPVSP